MNSLPFLNEEKWKAKHSKLCCVCIWFTNLLPIFLRIEILCIKSLNNNKQKMRKEDIENMNRKKENRNFFFFRAKMYWISIEWENIKDVKWEKWKRERIFRFDDEVASASTRIFIHFNSNRKNFSFDYNWKCTNQWIQWLFVYSNSFSSFRTVNWTQSSPKLTLP